jgi:hypothetical protein
MSSKAVAAFLRQAAQDTNLQHALAEFAARHGFRFTPNELGADLKRLSGAILDSANPSLPTPIESEDDWADRGFGPIEYPA